MSTHPGAWVEIEDEERTLVTLRYEHLPVDKLHAIHDAVCAVLNE